MARPYLFRALPQRIKEPLYWRKYHKRHVEWPHLFKAAPLDLCPGVAMYDLVPGDAISGLIAFTGSYERSLSKRITAHAVEGGLFVDVGANMGYFSLLWAGASERARVVAIEASPRNVEILRNNIERNRLQERITLVPKAAGDHAGTITFDVGPAEQTGWGGISRGQSETSIRVPLVRLDEQLPGVEIRVLKIDVEGADTLVLRGCESLLRQKLVHTIYFEQNRPRMAELGIAMDDAERFLESVGYECRPLDQSGTEWMAYPCS